MNKKSLPTTIIDADKRISPALASTLQSILLLFCLLFPLSFMQLILHEGGHALIHLILGGRIDVFYAHPFALDGYVRPILYWDNVWTHVSGPVVAILVSLLIFTLFWKRRSLTILPIVLLFPWSAIRASMGLINLAAKTGDYYNIIQITGMPATVFYIMGFILAVVGIFFFISLFPLLGLAPEELSSLFVVPAGLFLWGLLGIGVAYLCVPGSRIDVQYHMGASLLMSVKIYPFLGAVMGALLAVIYITLYRRVYKSLPAGLQTDIVSLSWRDLRNPSLLFTISVILGIIAIH